MPVDLGAGALATLGPASVVLGALTTVVFSSTTDRSALRRVANRILAHVLEFRLFLDEPLLVLTAQRELIRANLQLARLLLLPCLILTVPVGFLMHELNSLYGRAPLRVGEAAVVTAKAPAPALKLPAGIAIETPPVHSQGQLSWRVRPSAYIPVRSVLQQASAGLEIPFPPASILRLHWLVWFFLFSASAAIATRSLQ
jgi:hypothetical protein